MKNKNCLFSKDIKTMFSLHAFKLVYLANPLLYLLISVSIFSVVWISFNILDQLLFSSPVLYFYVPDDAVTGFILTNMIAFFIGIMVSMNVYLIRNSKLKLNKTLFAGSFIGIASSICASCSSLYWNSFQHMC